MSFFSRKVKFFLIILIILIGAGVFSPSFPVLAETGSNYGLKSTAEALSSIVPIPGDVDQNTIAGVIGTYISFMLGFVGITFLLVIIYGGILWMTASGNEEQVKKARGFVTNSIIGLLLVVCAYLIVYFVMDFLPAIG